jgi:uncharacterized protein YbjT (DUF2867 family)
VRAFVRDPQRATDRLGGDVDLAVGDFADPVSLRRAMQGVDRVFLTCTDGPHNVTYENAVIDAAAAGWAQRIVKLSAIGAEVGSPSIFTDAHGRIERHLRACPVPAVVLNSSFYMSNLFTAGDTIRRSGQIYAPAGDAKIAMIDPRDVAAAAAITLLEDGHDGRAYVLTGPQPITYTEVATHLSAATGRAVSFIDVPDEAAHAGLLHSGAPQWMADGLVTLFAALRSGLAAHTTDDVRRLTRRHPRSLAEFARDHRTMFTG